MVKVSTVPLGTEDQARNDVGNTMTGLVGCVVVVINCCSQGCRGLRSRPRQEGGVFVFFYFLVSFGSVIS